ncbi:MAG: RpiB/LacA/LacB family sugar-phosphate isomerase [Candidatus Liptonbacteria bacterium]
MVIYLGADHRGFRLKETLKALLLKHGYEVVDCGANKENPDDDYADFASEVGSRVSQASDVSRGVLLCGSGAGMDMVANKFKNVRSVLGFVPDQVYAARHDDDANVLCVAADFANEKQARAMLAVFLETPFSNEERHMRRLEKIQQLEI